MEPPKGINGARNDQGESIGFREKLNMYFGEFLPANVNIFFVISFFYLLY